METFQILLFVKTSRFCNFHWRSSFPASEGSSVNSRLVEDKMSVFIKAFCTRLMGLSMIYLLELWCNAIWQPPQSNMHPQTIVFWVFPLKMCRKTLNKYCMCVFALKVCAIIWRIQSLKNWEFNLKAFC